MSNITNLVITTSISEDVEYLQRKFREYMTNSGPFELTSVDGENLPKSWYGGGKLLEVNLFIGAYNYFDINSFVRFIHDNILWETPDSVQIFYKSQNEEKFIEINLLPRSA